MRCLTVVICKLYRFLYYVLSRFARQSWIYGTPQRIQRAKKSMSLRSGVYIIWATHYRVQWTHFSIDFAAITMHCSFKSESVLVTVQSKFQQLIQRFHAFQIQHCVSLRLNSFDGCRQLLERLLVVTMKFYLLSRETLFLSKVTALRRKSLGMNFINSVRHQLKRDQHLLFHSSRSFTHIHPNI